MSNGGNIGVNAEAASKILDSGSEFKLPEASRDDLRAMSREEWMDKFGEVYASEQHFEAKDPNWAENERSWWYQESGRAGDEPPLWMRKQVTNTHLPYLRFS